MSAPSVPNAYPAPGEIIDGKYQIEKILGEGGMGCVARAYHRVLHAPVALKFMNPMFLTFPGAVERFINEGKASSLIKSDHIVPVSDAGKTANGTPFLVMECLEGADLSDVLVRDGTPGLPVGRAVHFVLQILRGLQAAHAIDIVHRDMKPSNCFVVNRDGEDDFVKILDFGISKVAQAAGSASLTQTNSALGTPLYMSPEQARSARDVDARSDIYSVGVILYELFTGHTPFVSEQGEFTEILFKLFTAEPPPVQAARPDLPDGLAEAVHRALSKEVDARFPTALAMAEALEDFAGGQSDGIVGRMRGFKAPPKGSLAPPEALPPSMVAFSEMDVRTAVLPKKTDGQDPLVTELMADAPHSPSGDAAARHRAPIAAAPISDGVMSAAPVARRVPSAAARTLGEFPSAPPVAGVSPPFRSVPAAPISDTILKTNEPPGALAVSTPPPRPSPMIYALPLIALAGIAAVTFVIARGGGGTHGSATAAAAAPVATSAPIPRGIATPSSVPSAIVTMTPSATPSASASVTAPRPSARPIARPSAPAFNPLSTPILQ